METFFCEHILLNISYKWMTLPGPIEHIIMQRGMSQLFSFLTSFNFKTKYGKI